MSATPHFLDTAKARGVALLVALAAAAALGWINRDAFLGGAEKTAASGNPELAACLAERVGAVDTMRSEGIVNDAQYAAFRARAEDFCRAQFPDSR